ncbi:MAG: acVLRF1 family peptidyl-tRNA hydrolase [Dermatophilaceae bacterium]
MVADGRIDVAPERFPGWLQALLDEHPGAMVEPDGSTIAVRWDGGMARCERFPHDPLGIVLVRRGGYAVGLGVGARLVASKAGRRHVQSRTAAGGWSQQRYARRRAGQAQVLVDAVAGHAAGVLLGGEHPRPAGLVVGGDRALVAQVLADRRLTGIPDVPRREVAGLPDPDAAVLSRALWLGRAVRVTLGQTPADEVPEGP